jgi:hypothetical protein
LIISHFVIHSWLVAFSGENVMVVTSTIDSDIWLANVLFHIRVYSFNCVGSSVFVRLSGVLDKSVGLIASCASCAPDAFVL